MRITGGIHRSRKIVAPAGKAVRPSTDRTREGLFNRLVHRKDLDGATVVDLFAGSGALGLEALSRGATTVTFVDSSRNSLSALRKNVETLGVSDQTSIIQSDVGGFLRQTALKADIVLCDPPYDRPDLEALITDAMKIVLPDGFLILEHAAQYAFDDHDYFVTSGTYGKSRVTFFGQTN